jgi:tRNA threonylcarbamoyladenosine biosynthesis protein TsaB
VSVLEETSATSPTAEPLLLAIDTSGPAGTVALARGDALLAERRFDLHQKHAQVLLPGIRDLLRDVGVTARELDLLGVSVGPGSFTGLRVGVMCAKTLAYATGAKLIPIATLAAIFRTVCGDQPVESNVWVVENAQRGELFTLWVPAGTVPTGEAGPLGVMSVDELRAGLEPQDLVIGPGRSLLDVAVEAGGETRRPLPTHESPDRPAGQTLVRMSWELAAAGKFADPWTLEPAYIRRSAAEDQWLARQGTRMQ